jgi:hypothetical protein
MKKLTSILLILIAGLSLQAQDLVINTFDEEEHTGGAHITKSFTFPNDMSIYDSISMRIALTCPPGGCDPWDRFANIKVKTATQKIEIGRYMTPYGNDWCDWTIDVTDYKNYLEGTVELISHVDTWNKGWAVTVDFECFLGTEEYAYVTVQNVWTDYDFTYGDTLFYSIDLAEKNYTIPSDAQKVVMRINNTGHGQGNTDNAAEFSQKTHEIHANNSVYTQALWKADCAQNPCSPQAGTWQYPRAGWCPGQAVTPWDYDVTNDVTPGQLLSVDYVLEPYFNECSPFNPGCNSSICTQCTYNSNTHTRPHYKIAAQLLVYSNTPVIITELNNVAPINDIDLHPNPTTGTLNIDFKQLKVENAEVKVLDINGRVVYSTTLSSATGAETIDLSALENGVYLINIVSEEITFNEKIIISK